MSFNDTSAPLLVVSVHGIRTFGQWQERLEKLVHEAQPEAVVQNYHYGFFSVLAFLIPPLRWIEVRRFRRHLLRICEMYPAGRTVVIGHSFGTHLIGWALASNFKRATPIDLVILAGSVLRSSFDWHELVRRKVIKQVVNDCGIHDNVLLLSQFAVLFTGMAGRLGFVGAAGIDLHNRYFRGGHSHYFTDHAGLPHDVFMQRHWLPLILSNVRPARVDERSTPTSLGGAAFWFVQNADVIKIGAILVLSVSAWNALYVAPRVAAQTSQLARDRAIAVQQLSVDEQIPAALAGLLHVLQRDPKDAAVRNLIARWLPELVDLEQETRHTGLPAFFSWSGRNILVTQSSQRNLGGATIVSYGFTSNGRYLATFDEQYSIRVFSSETGSELVRIDTARRSEAQTRLAARLDMEKERGVWSHDRLLELSTKLPIELSGIHFLPGPEGYMLGLGFSASTYAGGVEQVLFAVNLRTGRTAFLSLEEFGDLLLTFEGEVRAWLVNADRQRTRMTSFLEIGWPQNEDGFRFLPSSESRAKFFDKRLVSLRRPTDKLYEHVLGNVAKRDRGSRSGGELSYPGLRPLNEIWLEQPLTQSAQETDPRRQDQSLRTARGLTEEESARVIAAMVRYAARVHEDSDASRYIRTHANPAIRGVSAIERDQRAMYFLRASEGSKYGVVIFCAARLPLNDLEYCDAVLYHGNYGALAVSPDLTLVAVGDYQSMGSPGLHVRRIGLGQPLRVDREPAGGVDHLEFDEKGRELFVRAPAGLMRYEIDPLFRAGLYQLPMLRATPGSKRSGSVTWQLAADKIVSVWKGVVQSQERTMGQRQWLAPVPATSGALAVSVRHDIVAVYDEECVHLLQLSTGARAGRSLCLSTYLEEEAMATGNPETQAESIHRVEISDAGTIRVTTSRRVLKREIGTIHPAMQAAPPVVNSWLERSFILGSAELLWTGRAPLELLTGHDYSVTPPRALEKLPLPVRE